MAKIDRVFIDTSELFPFTIMDVLLTLAENLLITCVWTDELLDEWEHVIVRERRRTAESARSVTDAARTWFGAGRIDPASYRKWITADLSPDPGDRIHVAACLDGRVDVLLTRNLTDYTTPLLAEHHVAVMTADDYLGFRGSDSAVRNVVGGLGVVYLAVGVLGFFVPDLFDLLPSEDTVVDNAIHLLLGVLGIAVGYVIGRRADSRLAT